jgi:hypothetical protein
MKTTLQYVSLNAQATWHRQVEEQLKQANREIADHLLAFARQFSADSKAAPLP